MDVSAGSPEVSLHVYPSIGEKMDSLFLQHKTLSFRSSEGESRAQLSLPIYHPMAGHYSWIGIAMEGPTHHPGPPRISQQRCNLSIGPHLPTGNGRYELIDLGKITLHRTSSSRGNMSVRFLLLASRLAFSMTAWGKVSHWAISKRSWRIRSGSSPKVTRSGVFGL